MTARQPSRCVSSRTVRLVPSRHGSDGQVPPSHSDAESRCRSGDLNGLGRQRQRSDQGGVHDEVRTFTRSRGLFHRGPLGRRRAGADVPTRPRRRLSRAFRGIQPALRRAASGWRRRRAGQPRDRARRDRKRWDLRGQSGALRDPLEPCPRHRHHHQHPHRCRRPRADRASGRHGGHRYLEDGCPGLQHQRRRVRRVERVPGASAGGLRLRRSAELVRALPEEERQREPQQPHRCPRRAGVVLRGRHRDQVQAAPPVSTSITWGSASTTRCSRGTWTARARSGRRCGSSRSFSSEVG